MCLGTGVSVGVDVRIQRRGRVLGPRSGSGIGFGVKVRFWDKRRVKDSRPELWSRFGTRDEARILVRNQGWDSLSGLSLGTKVGVRIWDIH